MRSRRCAGAATLSTVPKHLPDKDRDYLRLIWRTRQTAERTVEGTAQELSVAGFLAPTLADKRSAVSAPRIVAVYVVRKWRRPGASKGAYWTKLDRRFGKVAGWTITI